MIVLLLAMFSVMLLAIKLCDWYLDFLDKDLKSD